MAQCLHGDGAKVVFRNRGLVVEDGQKVEADLFTGVPTLARQTVTLIARAGAFRIEPVQPGVDRTVLAEVVSFSGYQRLADAEDDTRTTALQALAAAFVGTTPDDPPKTDPLPAIYTYFGQFIAHEVSRLYRPRKGFFENLGTSSFDLDTVFYPGGEFTAAAQQFAPLCVSFGAAALGNTAPAETPNLADLPRSPSGEPVVPDCRNDANPALAQLYVAILQKYRALVNKHGEADARMRLKRLLHAITIHDYLREIVDDCVYEDVLGSGRKLVNPNQDQPLFFLTPIEFAAGAFRFGHAMVRSSYEWSRTGLGREAELPELMRHTYVGGGLDLDGPARIRRMPFDWTMAKADMLRCPSGAEPNLADRITPALASGLLSLKGKFVPNAGELYVNLAEKTLLRGQEVRLASAQSIWTLIKTTCGRFLSYDEITGPPGSRFHVALTMSDGGAPSLAERTPLWFYVLREAEVLHCGRKLGPLGGRIVMETIHAAIAAAGGVPHSLPHATLADLFDLTTT